MKSLIAPGSPAFWLGASLLAAIVATNFAWLILKVLAKRDGAAGRRAGSVVSAFGWLLVSLFFLLPPPVAWRTGALSPRLMGLTGIDWVTSLRAGATLMFLIVGLLIFGWLVYRRSLAGDRSRTRLARIGATLRAPIDVALLQWHWAFYRALAIALLPLLAAALGSGEVLRPLGEALRAAPLYWGSWLGLALITLEWALNPFARADLHLAGRRETALLRVALAVATTALFIITPNLWLLMIAHLAVETVIAGWLSLPKQTDPASPLGNRARDS
jgi:hypothetical protein